MNFFKPKFWDKNQISILSIFLLPISLIVKLLATIREFITKENHPSIPIICIGNIYIGGTGKTPLSMEIFSILKNLNMNPGFIRKKYKSFQDEIDLMKKIGPIYQNKKRLVAINEATLNKINIAILDDGFQDFSIKKNLSIVCFNEKQWIGNGLTIPSGPLRESLSALIRAHIVIINGEKNKDIENKIYEKNNNIKIFYTKYIPEKTEKIEKRKVIAFAGIGNPDNFFDLLNKMNVNIINKIEFPDHHKYTKKELENLINKSKKNNSILLTTEKDYVKIPKQFKNDFEFLKIKVLIENKDQFINEIKKII